MKAVLDDGGRRRAGKVRDVHPRGAGAHPLDGGGLVERVDFRRHALPFAPGGKRRHSPVGQAHEDHVRRIPAGRCHRTAEQPPQSCAEFRRGASPVLVVDADQQRDEPVRPPGRPLRNAERELVRRPARTRDVLGFADPDACRPQCARELRGPAVPFGDTLTNRVRIAEREVSGPAQSGGRYAGTCAPVKSTISRSAVSWRKTTLLSESMRRLQFVRYTPSGR